MYKLFESLSNVKHTSGIYFLKIAHHAYVGSSIDLQRRLHNHRKDLRKGRSSNSFLLRTFKKYGEDECYYSILENCLAEDRLVREKFWIDTLDPDLNLERDPTTQRGSLSSSKRVYQFTLTGQFVTSFESASSAFRQTGISGISVCANPNIVKSKSAGGYLWSYEAKPYTYNNNSNKSKIREVEMYSLEGKHLKTFCSIADCARYLIEKESSIDYKNFDTLCSVISSCSKNWNYTLKKRFKFRM